MLELRGITAGYGSHTVLRDVDVVVPDRAVVALLGANGAGKTTLLRVASGLLAPTAGAVLVDGVDLAGAAPHQLATAGVCHVPEGRGVFGTLDVGDNIRLQAAAGNERQGTADVVRSFPRLGERLLQRAGTLSGGEQQMLAIARAYVAAAPTVLLDEVSMGLAPKIVDEIFDHLEELVDRGAALLLVEQYVSRALELADYVYILNKGTIEFVGEPGEIGSDRVLASYLGSDH